MSEHYCNPTLPDDVIKKHIFSFLGPMTLSVRLLNNEYYHFYLVELRKKAGKIVNKSRKEKTRTLRDGIHEEKVHVVLQSPERKIKGLYFSSDEKMSVDTLIPYLETGWTMMEPNYHGNYMINQSRYLPRRRLLPPPGYLL